MWRAVDVLARLSVSLHVHVQVRLHWKEAEGPCKARALAASLWNEEEFVLQIDAHMRCALLLAVVHSS